MKVVNKKIFQVSNFRISRKNEYATHLPVIYDKCIKFEADPSHMREVTGGRTDGLPIFVCYQNKFSVNCHCAWSVDEISNASIHYTDVIMGVIAFQIISLTIVYTHVCSGTDQIKHQSSASLVFVRGIHWGPKNSPHKRHVTRKMFPFDDVIMTIQFTPNHCV